MPPADAARAARMPSGYEFVRVLGAGGSGSVALARQAALDRLVAIKTVYAARYADTEARRLGREGRALAQLHDERIVEVYALEAVGDDVALVLEYVAGGDLRQALDHESQSGQVVRQALLDTAEALSRAATAQIVHRDVKPANVLLTTDGHAKLADFGVARLSASAGAFRTGGSVLIGTPLYIAPEQIAEPDTESPLADAYSFAVMAYEVLVGRPPFTAASADGVLAAHRSEQPPRPRDLRPSLSKRAEQALLGGLAKTPDDRPTPVELMSALPDAGHDWELPTRVGRRPAPRDEAPTLAGADALLPRAPAARSARTVHLDVPAVPWLEPNAVTSGPRATRRRSLELSPVAVGVIAGIVIAVVVLLLLT